MGHHIGYKRVSTVGQGSERQLAAPGEFTIDRWFEDKVSGSTKERPQLVAMLDHIRAGDVVHVHSIDRLARNIADLLALVKAINEKGACLRFHKENLHFSGNGNSDAMQNLQLQMMGAFAEFERALINERANEGREIARAKGVKFGRKPALSEKERASVCLAHSNGKRVRDIAIDFDVSRAMVYRILDAEKLPS